MTTPVPANPTPSPAPIEGQPEVTANQDHPIQQFWEKNSRTIYIVCATILVVIIAKGGLDAYGRYKDDKLGSEFAACNTPEKLKAFASANTGHSLAAVARLRLADEAYTAGNYTQAATEYQAAAEALKESPFYSRARVGVATAKLQAGQTSEAEKLFDQIAKDTTLFKAARAEAAYNLATLAAAAGRNDEALKNLDLINTIEARGSWAFRAFQLRATLPAPVAIPTVPAVNLPTAKP